MGKPRREPASAASGLSLSTDLLERAKKSGAGLKKTKLTTDFNLPIKSFKKQWIRKRLKLLRVRIPDLLANLQAYASNVIRT